MKFVSNQMFSYNFLIRLFLVFSTEKVTTMNSHTVLHTISFAFHCSETHLFIPMLDLLDRILLC